MDLIVTLTDEQYKRYKAAFKKLYNMEEDPTDEQLIAQLKREAAAVTYAAEVEPGQTPENWAY